MKVDGGIPELLAEVPQAARYLEQQGYDGAWSAEIKHDPFLPLVLAAEHTSRLELGTRIAVALARNPMTLAHIGWDLQAYSRGRFMLGLGSQVKAHIEKRYSMPWSQPAPRMRELILAMRAIWARWQDGAPLRFKGDFYTHELMTPFFTPEPNAYGPPRVFLAAVGEHMTEVCGEVADGLLSHAFTTERYLREITMPALERGLARSGRSRRAFELSCRIFVIADEADDRPVRDQIAFYASTPAYRRVLEMHGWDDLQGELNTMSKDGRWAEMAELVTDEMLESFAIVAAPAEVPGKILGRYGDLLDRVTLYRPGSTVDDSLHRVSAQFHSRLV